ncbi:MAG: hypothetical protein AABY00_02080 [Nanoarchaeota archaeon]
MDYEYIKQEELKYIARVSEPGQVETTFNDGGYPRCKIEYYRNFLGKKVTYNAALQKLTELGIPAYVSAIQQYANRSFGEEYEFDCEALLNNPANIDFLEEILRGTYRIEIDETFIGRHMPVGRLERNTLEDVAKKWFAHKKSSLMNEGVYVSTDTLQNFHYVLPHSSQMDVFQLSRNISKNDAEFFQRVGEWASINCGRSIDGETFYKHIKNVLHDLNFNADRFGRINHHLNENFRFSSLTYPEVPERAMKELSLIPEGGFVTEEYWRSLTYRDEKLSYNPARLQPYVRYLLLIEQRKMETRVLKELAKKGYALPDYNVEHT